MVGIVIFFILINLSLISPYRRCSFSVFLKYEYLAVQIGVKLAVWHLTELEAPLKACLSTRSVMPRDSKGLGSNTLRFLDFFLLSS